MDSMKGKRVLITGATSGVGKEIALGLSALGAELILGCRDSKKGKETASLIRRKVDSAKVTVLHVDMSSQASIRAFAKEVRKKFRRLDVLINNAATNRGALPKIDSVDGIELTFATNVLGYFLLTQELFDLLKRSAPARIINVVSAFAHSLDLDDLEFKRRRFEGSKGYAQSKACGRLFTWALARRLKGSGVTVNAMTPSLITTTGLYRNSPKELIKELTVYSGGRTIAQGADTAVWMASDPAFEKITNKFFLDREEQECEFRNKHDEEKLWKICERLVNARPD